MTTFHLLGTAFILLLVFSRPKTRMRLPQRSVREMLFDPKRIAAGEVLRRANKLAP